MRKLIIFTDGGSRGNPGPGAAAFIVNNDLGEKLCSEGKYLGIATNNQAEYQAVKMALEKVKAEFSGELPIQAEMRIDSLLVVEQLSGRYKIKNPILQEVVEQIKTVEKDIGQVVYIHIPRSQNFDADKLVNQTLDFHK